ncbi:hypothetical protein [Paenibacillus amylolyticus]|nr:hypothetical protein [Paenibacillus amylolyticus]
MTREESQGCKDSLDERTNETSPRTDGEHSRDDLVTSSWPAQDVRYT